MIRRHMIGRPLYEATVQYQASLTLDLIATGTAVPAGASAHV